MHGRRAFRKKYGVNPKNVARMFNENVTPTIVNATNIMLPIAKTLRAVGGLMENQIYYNTGYERMFRAGGRLMKASDAGILYAETLHQATKVADAIEHGKKEEDLIKHVQKTYFGAEKLYTDTKQNVEQIYSRFI